MGNPHQGVYKIVDGHLGWCVCRLAGINENGTERWHRVSNSYAYRGWAQAWARRMKIRVVNY